MNIYVYIYININIYIYIYVYSYIHIYVYSTIWVKSEANLPAAQQRACVCALRLWNTALENAFLTPATAFSW